MSETYKGPVVVLKEEELGPLAELLFLNPRDWNKDLRLRLRVAELQRAAEKARKQP